MRGNSYVISKQPQRYFAIKTNHIHILSELINNNIDMQIIDKRFLMFCKLHDLNHGTNKLTSLSVTSGEINLNIIK